MNEIVATEYFHRKSYYIFLVFGLVLVVTGQDVSTEATPQKVTLSLADTISAAVAAALAEKPDVEKPVEKPKDPRLTGDPRVDYVYDPNLPHELNGHNMSTYPFFSRVPPLSTFECDGLHDGFYASIEHSCQVRHFIWII